jgi:hypothetical protein
MNSRLDIKLEQQQAEVILYLDGKKTQLDSISRVGGIVSGLSLINPTMREGV